MATINWAGDEYQIIDPKNMLAMVISNEVLRAGMEKSNLAQKIESMRLNLDGAAKELADGNIPHIYSNPGQLELALAAYRQRCEAVTNLIHASLDNGLLARLV